MTTQDGYERMRAWLTRPGASRAANERGSCLYIMADGNRCAIGAILSPAATEEMRGACIPIDDIFAPDEEKLSAYGKTFPITREELSHLDFEFLLQAQIIHDDSGNWEGGRFAVEILDELALQHGLLPVVEEEVEEAVERELVLV